MQLEDIGAIELLKLGNSTLTIGGLIAGAVLMTGFALAAYLIGSALRRLRLRTREGSTALFIAEKVLAYGLVVLGIVAALSSLGLDLSSVAVFAGALGVGLGLGLQGIVKEFVSGLVLVFDRAVQMGDYIELQDGTRGVVQEIGPRATRVRNNDNVYLLVPNSQLIETTMINWTRRGETRRIHVPFHVALGADKEKVREAVIEAAREVPFTLSDTEERRTQVWLVGYGESSLNFELIVWPKLDAVKRPKAMIAAYTWAIDDALRKARVEIPIPQRDIRVRALFGEEGDAARDTLRLERSRPAYEAAAHTTVNDAAEDLLRAEPPEDEPENAPPADAAR